MDKIYDTEKSMDTEKLKYCPSNGGGNSIIHGRIVSVNQDYGFIQSTSGRLPEGYENKQVYFRLATFKGKAEELCKSADVCFILSKRNPSKPSAEKVFSKQDIDDNGSESHAANILQSPQVKPKADKEGNSCNKHDRNKLGSGNCKEKSKAAGKLSDTRKPKGKSKVLHGKISHIKEEGGFGFIKPSEKLPDKYTDKDVYFQLDRVRSGTLPLTQGDEVEFRLGILDKDFQKPKAFDCKVINFKSKNEKILIEFMRKVKRALASKSNSDSEDEEREEKVDLLSLISCGACWKAIGNSPFLNMVEILEYLIHMLLELQSKIQGLKGYFLEILDALTKSLLFDHWKGPLKRYIEHVYHADSVCGSKVREQLQDFLVLILMNVPQKSRAITAMLKPLVTRAEKGSRLHLMYSVLQAVSRGTSSEVDDLTWEELPLVPSTKELLSPLEKLGALNPVKKTGAYSSAHEYIDTYFRLLRADCFSKIREGLSNLFQGNLDPRDMHVYHSINVAGVQVSLSGNGLAVALKFVPQTPVKKWETCSHLMFGNLLCLSPTGNFRDPIWATVAARDVESLSKNQVVLVEFCTECNSDGDLDVIHRLTHSSGSVIMVESPTYYKAYQPVLQSLQSTDPEVLALKEQLVDIISPPRADYISSETTLDASSIYTGLETVSLDEMKEAPMLRAVDEGITTNLDNSQEKALIKCLDRKLSIIQGPPGTGKTFIGLKFIQLIKSMSTCPEGPLLVLTYKNHALDEFLKSALHIFPDGVVRVGGRSKEPELENHSLKQCARKVAYDETVRYLRQDILSEIDVLKDEIIKLMKDNHRCERLQLASLLNNLTDNQVQKLILGCDWSKQSLQLASVGTQEQVTSVLKYHLERFYLKKLAFIPKNNIKQILDRCRKVIRPLVKKPKNKTQIANIATAIDQELYKWFYEDFQEDNTRHLDELFLLVAHEIPEKLKQEKATPVDIKSLISKPRIPLREYLLSGENSSLWRDLHKIMTAAVESWLPSKTVFTAVERSFSNKLILGTSSFHKETSDPEADDIFDEHDIREEEQERMSAMAMSRQKQGNMDDVVIFKEHTGSSTFDVRLFIDTNELHESYPVISLINAANLWDLMDEERVILTQALIAKEIESGSDALDSALHKFQSLIQQKEELELSHQVRLLKEKDIIGMTITGASINIKLLKQLKPSIILVEEAAEVLEAQLLAILGPWVQQLILIGDHKQLRPQVETHELRVHCNFDISLMERMILNEMPYETLAKQNRMRPEFAELLKDIYPALQSNMERVSKNQPPECVMKSMFFWDHEDEEEDARSFRNPGEAERVISFVMYLLRQGYGPEQLTILAAYQGQIGLLRRLMRDQEKKYPALFDKVTVPFESDEESKASRPKVNIHTIDLYQGDENDIVIVSLVRSNTRRNTGFLKLLNRRCVAQSRSRCGLYFVGNCSTLQSSDHWDKLIKEMQKQDCVGKQLPLCCPKHRLTSCVHAASANEVPEGNFCKELCAYTMPCLKHKCPQFCQPPHKHTQCKEDVCFIHSECKHPDKRKCYQNEENIKCNKQVNFTFPDCGHQGQKRCHQNESLFSCKADVIKTLTCGHEITRQCSDNSAGVKCKEPCPLNLACGHPCKLPCSQPCTQQECIICKQIIEEKQRQREKEARERYHEIARKELEQIQKNKSDGFIITDLLPDGDTASEYFDVEDRVKKYIQPGHNWFPQIQQIEKIENSSLLEKWWSFRGEKMKDPTRSELKFHGTGKNAAKNIIKCGFKLPGKAGMFGKGIYFATDSSKSAQEMYTKQSNMLLLCEVLLGKSKTVETASPDMSSVKLEEEGYDSVFAKRGTRSKGGVLYDEFVVYHPEQALPKYVIHYSRVSPSDLGIGKIEKEALTGGRLVRRNLTQRRTMDPDDEDDLHFRIAESQFLRLMKHQSSNIEIKSVDYYINPTLVEKFRKKSGYMQRSYGKTAPDFTKFILAFHGTAQKNIDSIVKNNFSLAKLSANTGDQGYYGAGIYFSEFPQISLGYGQKLLLCKVLPGKPYDCRSDRLMAGKPLQTGYDSHRVQKDKMGRGYEIVIFDPDQILPCYVIHT